MSQSVLVAAVQSLAGTVALMGSTVLKMLDTAHLSLSGKAWLARTDLEVNNHLVCRASMLSMLYASRT